MHILFAIKKLDSIAGGAERVLVTVCSELAKRGHNVNLLTFDEPNSQSFYKLSSKIKLIRISDNKKFINNKLFLFISRCIKIRRQINFIKPDIAVGFMHSIYVPLSFSLINKDINVIGSEHIVPEYYKHRKLEYFLIMFSTFFLKKITVLSDDIRFSFHPIISRKMITVPNPIELKKFITKEKDKKTDKKTDKDTYKILSIGRLSDQKDHKTLIKAFNLISNDFPKWKLEIVGDGLLKKELVKLINKLNLSGRVFINEITSEIWNFYKESDLFVLPSKYESFGLVVAEAMTFKLPVIGFRNCFGINKLIVHNETGLLIESGFNRVESLSEGMRELMSSKLIRKKFGFAGQKYINSYYSKKYIIDLWERLLLENRY